MKPAGKGLILLMILGALVSLKLFWYDKRPKEVGVSMTATEGEVAIPDAPEASLTGSDAKKLPFPSETPAGGKYKGIHYEMAWQSQTGFNYANGGPRTTKGSIFASMDFDIEIQRKDDCIESQQKIAQFCKDYKDNKNTPFALATYMGSGIPAALYNISQLTKDLPAEYQPVAFMTFGKSYGEDQVMGDPKYRQNKDLLRGTVAVFVKLDGDGDLVMKLAGSFGIPFNPDPTTYDPNAINCKYVASYLDAAVQYNQNVTENRKIVINGKTTGRDTTVGIDLVSTWTPGDVNVHNGPRGANTVTIVSTKDYSAIMPAITITCRQWINDHRDLAANLIIGCAMAGDQIRSFDDVKRFATALNGKIWNEETSEYWYKYYNGVTVPSYNGSTGQNDQSNHLGGSMVYNLADMANMLGIYIKGQTDNSDIYGAVYNTFGNLQHKYYPSDLPSFIPFEKAFDKSILLQVISNHPELLKGSANLPTYTGEMTNKIGNKAWHIEFETGSSEIKESSRPILQDIYQEIIEADAAKAQLVGYTDNTGDAAPGGRDRNIQLSRNRANSVKRALINLGLSEARFYEPIGEGSNNPIGDNSTTEGKAQNRRVQITLLSK